MRNNELNDDNKGVGWPVVHAIATSTESGHSEQTISAQDYIDKQAKDAYFLEATSTLGLLVLRKTMIATDFWRVLHPSMLKFKNLFQRHYEHVFYFTRNFYVWQEIRVKNVGTTVRKDSTTGQTWQIPWIRLREMATHSSEVRPSINVYAPQKYFCRVARWKLLLRWASWDHFQRGEMEVSSQW